MSPTSKLHAAYEPISEAELLADGLIEPVRTPLDTSPLSSRGPESIDGVRVRSCS